VEGVAQPDARARSGITVKYSSHLILYDQSGKIDPAPDLGSIVPQKLNVKAPFTL
jgi:hypothetical protein